MKVFITALLIIPCLLTLGGNVRSTKAVAVTIYSGKCTLYKLTLVQGNKKKYTPVNTAFGKIVIDNRAKKFTFFYNDKLVFSYSDYLSYIDNDQGGEGFSFYDGWSAHRFIAEREFYVYKSTFGSSPDLGYEYQLINYKIN